MHVSSRVRERNGHFQYRRAAHFTLWLYVKYQKRRILFTFVSIDPVLKKVKHFCFKGKAILSEGHLKEADQCLVQVHYNIETDFFTQKYYFINGKNGFLNSCGCLNSLTPAPFISTIKCYHTN